MFNIKTFNKIAVKGLDMFPREQYDVASDINHPDAIILRSHKMHDEELPGTLKAIGRAGAGTNNIPIDKCTDQGIVVFNTPGANANAVKELVITAILLASRDILGGISFSKEVSQTNAAELSKEVEKNKSRFAGREVKGKQLGIVGLGAIGTMLANDAVNLGMTVMGYDPFISVDRAWDLSNEVKPAPSLEKLLKTSDYISLHVPLTEDTRGFLNKDKLKQLKTDAVILNFSRSEIVDENAMDAHLTEHPTFKYCSDFPSSCLMAHSNAIAIPHLGASTREAEENCAIMIAKQTMDYLENGNIRNSVNFPNCQLERTSEHRMVIINRNVPNMVGQITTALADESLNIVEMINKSRGDIAYSIVDTDGPITDQVITRLKQIEGVTKARALA